MPCVSTGTRRAEKEVILEHALVKVRIPLVPATDSALVMM